MHQWPSEISRRTGTSHAGVQLSDASFAGRGSRSPPNGCAQASGFRTSIGAPISGMPLEQLSRKPMSRITRTLALAPVLFLQSWPVPARADHAPSALSATLDPDYTGCMLAVDDAAPEVRPALQSTCLSRMADLCGDGGEAPDSETVRCLNVEAERAIGFLIDALPDLPEVMEGQGLTARFYPRRRETLAAQIGELQAGQEPSDLSSAAERSAAIAVATGVLLWLARETGTPPEAPSRAVRAMKH